MRSRDVRALDDDTPSSARRGRFGGFTLVEMLVSLALFMFILVATFSVINQTTSVWQRSKQDLEAFQGARQAFETITRLASQATLNTYWDYQYDSTGKAIRYRRNSDLHFVVGGAGADNLPGTPGYGQALFFQAPTGRRADTAASQRMPELLNEIGFYVEFGSNEEWLPAGVKSRLASKSAFRLFQAMQPAEGLDVYKESSNAWIKPPGAARPANAYPIADNIVALAVLPKRSAPDEVTHGPLLTTSYYYDTRLNANEAAQPVTAHQLPPFLLIALVAIDSDTAARLQISGAPPAAIVQALAGRFVSPNDFERDIAEVEQAFVDAKIPSRIFSTAVQLKESKWSEY